MQVINSVLCLLLIPIFERILYPLLERCNILVNPLKRLALGAFLVAISFVMAGVLELKMEVSACLIHGMAFQFVKTIPSGHFQPTYAVIPDALESNVNFINSLPCQLNISLKKSRGGADIAPDLESRTLAPYENTVFTKLRSWTYDVNLDPSHSPCIADGMNLVFKPVEIEVYSEQVNLTYLAFGSL